jgi:hypothetical protein
MFDTLKARLLCRLEETGIFRFERLLEERGSLRYEGADPNWLLPARHWPDSMWGRPQVLDWSTEAGRWVAREIDPELVGRVVDVMYASGPVRYGLAVGILESLEAAVGMGVGGNIVFYQVFWALKQTVADGARSIPFAPERAIVARELEALLSPHVGNRAALRSRILHLVERATYLQVMSSEEMRQLEADLDSGVELPERQPIARAAQFRWTSSKTKEASVEATRFGRSAVGPLDLRTSQDDSGEHLVEAVIAGKSQPIARFGRRGDALLLAAALEQALMVWLPLFGAADSDP